MTGLRDEDELHRPAHSASGIAEPVCQSNVFGAISASVDERDQMVHAGTHSVRPFSRPGYGATAEMAPPAVALSDLLAIVGHRP